MTKEKKKEKEGRLIWSESIGAVSASVFENENDSGSVWHNVSFSRSYTNGDETKYTHSFRQQDLMNVRQLADLSFETVQERRRELRAASSE